MQNDIQSKNCKEIERLYRLEYGDAAEFWFRMVGTLVGAFIIWLYTGWNVTWVWLVAYNTLHLVFFLLLRAKRHHASAMDVLIARALFPCILASFIWMPILMISSPDDALSASGFTILAGVIVFVVRRSEEHLKMMLIEIAVIAVFLGVAVIVILARYTNPLAWLGLAFGASTLIFYVTQTAVIVRRQRIRADELSVRTMHAEKMEAIGKLAGGVAHDFNNLLTVILGNLDLTIEIKDDDTRQQLLHDARSATLRGASVVRQLLTYARQTESTPQVTDAAVLLSSVETMCRTLIPATVTLTIATPQLPMSVAVDDALFITAILNLIKNGIDAIEGAGRIDLTVKPLKLTKPKLSSAGQTMSAGNYLAFTVTDSGPGIPADTLSRVFDPFFTTKPVGKGTGLGLSMVAGFAIQSGGGIEIKSSEGGTGVSLLLPDVASFPRGTLDLTKKDAAS